MRPLRLTFSALGPYAEPQVLDFRRLGGRSFFLIHGPTGSGKTTILDALCYALYGESSGGERNGSQMRSDHCNPSVATEVTLDFALGAERYRVVRGPDQERPKRRGQGTTVQSAWAELYRRTGLDDDDEPGKLLASKPSDVTAELVRLLGFESEQFRQVIVLPQGQFRRLLVADSRDRQAILETLFQTEFYRRIEGALKEASRGLRQEIDRMRQTRQMILEQARAESDTELAERRDVMARELAVLRDTTERLRGERDRARAALDQARDADRRLKELERAEADRGNAEDALPDHEARRETLRRARRAADLRDAEALAASCARDRDAAAEAVAAAEARLSEADAAVARARAGLEAERARDDERQELERTRARLEEAAVRVGLLEEARRALAEAETAAAEKDGEYSRERNWLDGLNAQLEAARRVRDETAGADLRSETLRRDLERAERLHTGRVRLDRLLEDKAAAEAVWAGVRERREQADREYDAARAAFNELEALWRDGQAAVLARTLTPGEACPVCGSREHPAPARSEAEVPGEAEMEARRQARDRLEAEREKLRIEEARVEQKAIEAATAAASREEELGEDRHRSAAELDAEVARLREALEQAEADRARHAELTEEVRTLEERRAGAAERLERARAASESARAEVERRRAVAAERETALPEDLRTSEALDAARSAAQTALEALRTAFDAAQRNAAAAAEEQARVQSALQAAKEQSARAAERAAAAEADFSARIRAVFVDEDDYRDARRSPEEIERLEEDVRRFESHLEAVRARVAQAREAARDLEPPDLDAAAAVLDGITRRLDEAHTRRGALDEQLRKTEEDLERLEEIAREAAELEVRYAVLGRVADVAGGQNAYGMTFQRFVLTSLLDDVLRVGSRRLDIMSKGRYRLERRLDRGDRRMAGGLDLQVYDAYTGTARPVHTLSGGESFMAALGLALGLAEVVQAYSGGIRLDTVFVDEGFGSLDPESLDLALRALVDLQKDGRLVGIISHVPELRERIDVRLEVISDRRGSTARFVLP